MLYLMPLLTVLFFVNYASSGGGIRLGCSVHGHFHCILIQQPCFSKSNKSKVMQVAAATCFTSRKLSDYPHRASY